MSDIIKAQGVSMEAIEGFGERSIATTSDVNQSRAIAQATAQVQARFIVAAKNRRDWSDVRVRLLNECKRPGFAKSARYRKPIGQGIEGPSIRFAEACIRYAGNFDSTVTTIREDAYQRTLSVQVIDLESNASFSTEITIDKTIERKDAKGRQIISERTNSYGQRVYIVAATEDELLNKQNALVSKAIRTNGLRMIPGDIVEEAQELCQRVQQDDAAKDPSGNRKALYDAFAGVGVMPSDLARYLGHSADVVQPAEIVELRAVFTAIKDGETTWAAVLDGKGVKEGASKVEALKDRIKQKAASKKEETVNVVTGEVYVHEKASSDEWEEGRD